MEDEIRQRKIAAGREKLAKYKKRKSGNKEKGTDSEQSSLSLSDTSLSLSPLPMSETTSKPKKSAPVPVPQDTHSESSSISENIELANSNSNSNSENDRSLQEILIGNIPLDSPELSLVTSVVNVNNPQVQSSLQTSLISDCSVISLNALEKFENNNFLDSSPHAQNILDEIIKHDDSFDHSKSESIQSNPFDDLSSITLKSERITGCENKTSQSDSKNKCSDVEVMANKEPIPSQAEIDSLKEVNSSNPSTLSTTEYKQYYDKVNLGTIEYQDLLSHRDDHIKQLTDALQQVLEDRNHLQEQTDYFAHEIADLKEQLIQTTAIIKKNKWNVALVNESLSDDMKEKKQPNTIKSDETTESTSLQSLANELKLNNPKNYANVSEINFDFEDPEFNETMTPEEKKIVADMRTKINTYIQQRVEEHKQIYETEIKELQEQLNKQRVSSNKNTEDSVSSLPSSEGKDAPDFTKFEIDDQMFNDTFTEDELQVIADVRSKIFLFIQQNIDHCKTIHESELKILKDRMENEKVEHDAEIGRLRDLLATVKSGSAQLDALRDELNSKHNVEMEELRTYFEKLCADIEKHYSEEIISQQSRKMSGSSVSELESEIFPAQMGPAGDVLAINAETKSTDVNVNINNLRLELQNKYHAELEILREDYENRLDELKISHENNVQSIENKYDVIIKSLKEDLHEAQKNAVATQEVASSGDFEIAEVVQSYERRLQEQVMLAKIDIVSALEQQIQTLVSSPSDNLEWPPELLQLRDRLTEHWHSEIKEIKEQHTKEITQLREDHEKQLTRALERERRNSLKSGEEIEIKKERDALKKISSNLRHLVAELIKYFTKCEDELNNTLVEELLKYGFDKVDSDLNDSSHSEHSEHLLADVKRVHFTPDVSGIIDIINESNLDLDTSKDISNEFRTELDLCLSRLKSEANSILALSSNLKPKAFVETPSKQHVTHDDKVSSLTRQLITETQMKNEINIQLEETRGYVQSLEAEKQSLENQLEQMVAKQQVLNMELNNAKEKINDLVENGRKEIISEGYGESQIMGTTTLGERTISFAELQGKARMLLAEVEGTSHNPLHKLLDDLCREGDRLMEDAKTDHDDLIQQIEAADKKLRCTTQFLEEQAVERELERDEAQKEIAALREQLREVERTRVSCEQINTEDSHIKKLDACRSDFHITVLETVERLEAQMREMTVVMNDCETKKTEVENELKEAIDKIWVLRDIIRDLESQIEEKTKTEVDLKNIVTQLEDKITFETKHNEELIHKVQTLNNAPSEECQQMIRKLEAENQKLKVSSELIGPDGVLKQVKTQLNEIEKTLEKRTKDLESLHAVNTNCSSPSEDMSIRDQIRPPSSNEDNSDLPLEQLARLKDKLIRHARAEDAAMKRIRDLEMQLFTSKHDYEEMQSERDVLQEQLSEQLVLISSLQLRLDEQRLRVESAQKQSNTSFDRKVYELENEIQSLKEVIHIRDNNNKQLSIVVEQTKKRIAEQEKQLNNAVDIEKQIVDQFEAEISRLKNENEELKKKLQCEIDNSATQNFLNETLRSKSQSPETFAADTLDSLLGEKNADIDRLKSKLNEYKEELKFYSSLNLDKDQLLQLSSIHKANDTNNVTSLVESSEPDVHRRQEQSFESSIASASNNLEFKRNANETVFIGSTFRDSKYADKGHHSPFVASEISSIEKDSSSVPIPLNQEQQLQQHSKHVHFDESSELGNLEMKLSELQQEITTQNETIKTYEIDIEQLRRKLHFSDETIRDKTEEFTEKIDSLSEIIQNAKIEMAQLKLHLEQKEKKLEFLEKDTERKDKMFTNLVQEKRDLENKYKELEGRYAEFQNYEKIMADKNTEIYQLEQQLAEVVNFTPLSSTESLHESILLKEKEIERLTNTITGLETNIKQLTEECNKLTTKLMDTEKHLEKKNHLLEKNDKDYQNILFQFNELTNHIEELKLTLDDKCKTIADMERDLEREKELRDTIAEYQKELQELRNIIEENEKKLKEQSVDDIMELNYEVEQKVIANQLELEKKELEIFNQKTLIENLNKEIHHLQDYLNEKDKIIQQMTVDSNSLHSALEAIQSKIQESGNVVDLKKRLREEQNLTTALHEELKYLKQSIEQFETADSTDAMETLVLLKENIDKEKLHNLELKASNHTLSLEVKALREKHQAADKTVNKLTQLLADEKLNSNAIQVQDANIIESMRVRMEALLEHENETERQLKKEQEHRKQLEEKLYEYHYVEPVDTELTTLKLNQAQLVAENDIVKSDLETIKSLNQMLNTELQEAKDLIESQQTELKSLKYAVECLSQMKYDKKQEDDEHNVELFSKIEDENMFLKQKVDEMSKSVTSLREKEKELCQLLAVETNRQLDSVVPDKFLRKIRDINMLLQSHIADNKQLTHSLAVLTEENKLLQTRLKELEKPIPQLKSPFDDPVARADHLFGRYLKSESYRKALIFQKRYLLTLLASYQRGSSLNLAVLNVVHPKSSHSRGIHRFRVVVHAVMSIRRMQYIVQRWHTGKRIGASIVTKRPYVINRPFTAQPSLHYVTNALKTSRGNSPPSRERSFHKSEQLGDTIQEGIHLAPLQAPAMLSNYIERFDSIQRKLGLAIQKSST